MPDDDDQADKYLLADACSRPLGSTGTRCPTGRRPTTRDAHTTASTGPARDWWGIGPGAHSHVGGTRWWNVKHPAAYAQRLAAGESPAQAREVLDDETRRVERVLLETRLADGLDAQVLDDAGRVAAARLAGHGLIDPAPLEDGRVILTLRGRLLADAVVRDLLA